MRRFPTDGRISRGVVEIGQVSGAQPQPVHELMQFRADGQAQPGALILAEEDRKLDDAEEVGVSTKLSSKSTVFSEFGSAKSFGNTSQLLPYGVPLTIGTLMIFFGPHAWGGMF